MKRTNANQPAEFRELGRILNAIMSGERAPELSALPEGLAGAVRGMVEGIVRGDGSAV